MEHEVFTKKYHVLFSSTWILEVKSQPSRICKDIRVSYKYWAMFNVYPQCFNFRPSFCYLNNGYVTSK